MSNLSYQIAMLVISLIGVILTGGVCPVVKNKSLIGKTKHHTDVG